MSKDITTAGPSRRSIAKGAAWAVPAVSVAAAAPALAASTTLPLCSAAQITITVQNCDPLNLLTPAQTFTIAAAPGCAIPQGTSLTLTGAGLAEVGLDVLNDINAGVLFSDENNATLERAIEPETPLTVVVFPQDLSVSVIGTYTLSILGASKAFRLTGIGGVLALCSD